MSIRPLNLPVLALLATTIAPPLWAEDTISADTVVASVDGTDITLGHMIALRSGLPPQYAQLPPEMLFDGILDQLIQQTLLVQASKDAPSKKAALTIENETRAIVASEIISNLMDNAVSEEAIKAAYAEQYVNADPSTEYNAAHILVATKEEAEDLITKLADGAEFAALAREYSTGPSGANGGELGWFGQGVMVAPFFDAVTDLSVGNVSAPVQTDFGWHVIKLLDTRSKERPELEEVRDEIAETLRNAAFEAHVDKLKKLADIQKPEGDRITPDMLNSFDLLEN